MRAITHPRLLYLKAALFLLTGVLAAIALLLEAPTARQAVLLILSIWCFARAYYFVFYVIEHYIDPSYRFAGLIDFAMYLLRRRRQSRD